MRNFMLCILLFTAVSCKEPLIGTCSNPFSIVVNKPIKEDNLLVYYVDVKNYGKWWLSSMAVDGKYINEEFNSKFTQDSFIHDTESFIFEKVNNSKIKITVKENKKLLKLKIILQSGNCIDSFDVNQYHYNL